MTDLQSFWAEAAWERLVQRRRRRNRRRGAAVAFGLLLLLSAIILAVLQRERIAAAAPWTVRAIEISGNRSVTTPEVLDLLELRAGDPWWRYRPGSIRARAASSPSIQNLSLRYVWFHRLRVELTEREGSLAVLSPIVGEMSEDGWLLPASPIGEEHDLPIVRARGMAMPAPGSKVDGEMARLARLIGEMRRTRVDLWREISEIDLGPEEARAYLRSGRQIVLFTPGRHEDLWGKVPAVLEDLRNQGREDVVLDLRFPERIVVHLPEAIAPDTLLTQTGKERA